MADELSNAPPSQATRSKTGAKVVESRLKSATKTKATKGTEILPKLMGLQDRLLASRKDSEESEGTKQQLKDIAKAFSPTVKQISFPNRPKTPLAGTDVAKETRVVTIESDSNESDHEMEHQPARSALQLSTQPKMVESSDESQHLEGEEDILHGPGDNNQPEFTKEQERMILESPVKPMPIKATEQTQPTSLLDWQLPPIESWYDACKVDDEYLNYWAGQKAQSARDREVEEEHERLETPSEQSAFTRYTSKDEADNVIRRAAQSNMYS